MLSLSPVFNPFVHKFRYFLKSVCNVCLKGRDTRRDFPSAMSTGVRSPSAHNSQCGLDPDQIRSLKLSPGLQEGWQVPNNWATACCLPGCTSITNWNQNQRQESNLGTPTRDVFNYSTKHQPSSDIFLTWKAEWLTRKVKEFFHLLGHLLNTGTSKAGSHWNQEPGTLVSHMGSRNPSSWAIICCLPGCVSAGSRTRRRDQTRSQHSVMRAFHTAA